MRLAYATGSVNLRQILVGTLEGEGLEREEACCVEHHSKMDSTASSMD